MLKEVGVKSEIVYGYVHDEIIDSITLPLECTHAWIGIKLDGKWFLADPTWDAGYVGNIKTDKVESTKKNGLSTKRNLMLRKPK
jgi:transglutaminase/protease-like cytokinesis protein 3